MGNSVIHFVRAQSEQRFDTPPLGAVRASKASSPQYRLACHAEPLSASSTVAVKP